MNMFSANLDVLWGGLTSFATSLGIRRVRKPQTGRESEKSLSKDEKERRRELLRRGRDSPSRSVSPSASITPLPYSNGIEVEKQEGRSIHEKASDETQEGSLKRKNTDDGFENGAGTGDESIQSTPPNKKIKAPPESTLPLSDILGEQPLSDVPVELGEAQMVQDLPPSHESAPEKVSVQDTEPEPRRTEPESEPQQPQLSSPPALPVSSFATTPRATPPPATAPRVGGFAAYASSASPFSGSYTAVSLSSKTEGTTSRESAWSSSSSSGVSTGVPKAPAPIPMLQSTASLLGSAATSDHQHMSATEGEVAQYTDNLSLPSAPKPTTNGTHTDALAAHLPSSTATAPQAGAEDSNVAQELKGVRLYVKRGQREFSEGIIGHLKLLVSSTGNGEMQSLLFRRDPLKQVSMNVRLRPTVRCSFDAEQCVLRVALKEVVKFDSWSTGHNRVPGQGQMETELVVYALKPSKSARDAFGEIAEAVVQSTFLR